MIGEKRFLRSIQLRNLLSFGPDTQELELKSLNVLIGPNGSGKSNLIDAIGLLQAAPRDLMEPIRAGGGIGEWLWKGSPAGHGELAARVDFPLPNVYLSSISHELSLGTESQRASLFRESIKRWDKSTAFFRGPDGTASLAPRSVGVQGQQAVEPVKLELNQSILSQRKDPQAYPEITFLGSEYAKIKFFREWSLGRDAAARRAPQTDLPANFLSEDASNLALVLNSFEYYLSLRAVVLEKLRISDESIANYSFAVLGGTIQLFIHYEGLKTPVPATRLSDGTIHYLCLLAILCHPSPPPLVCIEEPELGLHPDLLPGLADLLIDASHQMQLIVTTHSDILVDALTKVPEAVVVCEKENGSTRMKRLDREALSAWLKDYGLGQLWRSGEIGGNRW
jgi:predicted ATPase